MDSKLSSQLGSINFSQASQKFLLESYKSKYMVSAWKTMMLGTRLYSRETREVSENKLKTDRKQKIEGVYPKI